MTFRRPSAKQIEARAAYSRGKYSGPKAEVPEPFTRVPCASVHSGYAIKAVRAELRAKIDKAVASRRRQ